jgi:hypothetical protein
MSDEFTEAWGSVQALRVAAAMSYVKPSREERHRLALAAEIDRLRAALEVSQAATDAAVNKAQWQARTNAELDATRLDAIRWRNPPSGFTTWGDLARHLQAEIERLTTCVESDAATKRVSNDGG